MRVIRRPPRASPPAARAVAAIIATAVLAPLAASRNLSTPTRRAGPHAALLVAVALLTGACAGSSTPSGQSSSSSSRSARMLAFSRCMRSHGVPQFPAPNPGPNPPDFKLPPPASQGYGGVSGSQIWSAVRTCHHLLPPGSSAWYPRAEIPRVLCELREFARCMRSHGISHWPDPSFDSQGRLAFHGPGADLAPGSAADHARNQCHHLLPPDDTDLLGG